MPSGTQERRFLARAYAGACRWRPFYCRPDGGFEIAHSMPAPPKNAAFAAASYVTVIDTGGDLIKVVPMTAQNADEMPCLVLANEGHTCADLV